VFGISLATFLLPTLTGLATDKNFAEFRATLRQGIGHLLLVNLLMAVLLVALAEPIIRLLFERGRFGPDSTLRATLALQCLGASLVAYSLVNVLARAFYALGDTRTPMRVSLFCLGLNLLFAVGLVFPFRQGGLGLANTVSSAFNLVLLLYALRRKLGRLDLGTLRPTLLPQGLAAALAGGVALGLSQLWNLKAGHDTLALKLGAVFVPGLVASAVYWLIALQAGIPAAREITALILRPLRRAPR
jgi:putative peptidoglycan lipid II flippase